MAGKEGLPMNRELESYIEELEHHEFFKCFSTEELNYFKSNVVIHQYRKGQILFFQEDPKMFSYYLLKGLIKLETTNSSGDYTYVDYVQEHNYFPYSESLDRQNYGYTAYARTDVDLMMISNNIMTEIMTSNVDLLIYMFKKLSNISVFLEKRIQMGSTPSASDRVVQALAIWMYDMGVTQKDKMVILHPLTINELAQVAGTTRETAGKVVKQIHKEGLINFTRQGIYYLKPDYFNNLMFN
ncbi:cyclic nucleotide-binding domain protein [Eremococcus coleocola ACS-139-V-Col8]|uniref:Cyclic nucleotide-binding domain protein n=2 Tax=Eremococcus TaxID=171412 RepID=E4KMJ2_9LACT|nr:cyclic nucleotide-binding domain protein [Eremococcus coleocola ACS-139-V-Col8]